MKKYDAIVIGSGNGGLIAATRMAQLNMKVLLLEQHNVPGGFASSFVRGRFEFEPALHELGALGDANNKGYIYKLFEELKIDNIKWNRIPEAFAIVLESNNKITKYSFPFGRKEFAQTMENYFPNTYKETLRFIDICKELYDCAIYLREKKGIFSSKELKKLYPDYLTTGSYTLKQVLDDFKLPFEAKNIISAYWVYLGLPPSQLDFTVYAIMFAEYIFYDAYIPTHRSNEISSAIVSKFQEYGGEIWFNSKVEKILTKDKTVYGVKLESQQELYTNNVVANCSPHTVYGQMIDKKEVPEYDQKLVNFKNINKQGFSFYIGLDIEHTKLNLNEYSYFMYSDIDLEKCYKNMKSIDKNLEYLVVVLNTANPQASPKGTCILSFTTLYDDAWNKVNDLNYVQIKENIAYRMIKDFERKMNVDIMSHIEEIEIATPVTFARYTGSKNGVIYGYNPSKNDSTMLRTRNMDKEINVKGLKFTGGFSFRGHGYSTTYMSGDVIAWKTFKEYKDGKKNEQ